MDVYAYGEAARLLDRGNELEDSLRLFLSINISPVPSKAMVFYSIVPVSPPEIT
jgi:hypothetical protein